MNFAIFRLVNFQRQLNTKDCGLFAIAVEAELVGNTGNALLQYVYCGDTKKFRSHLMFCFENQHIDHFPKKEMDRLRCLTSTMRRSDTQEKRGCFAYVKSLMTMMLWFNVMIVRSGFMKDALKDLALFGQSLELWWLYHNLLLT